MHHHKTLFLVLALKLAAATAFAQPCQLVADIHRDSSNQSAIVYQDEFTIIGNQVFFTGGECQQSPELYVLNVESGQIRMVKNIRDYDAESYRFCNVDPLWYVARPKNLTAGKNGQLFFSCPNDELGTELWVTDGSLAGTQLVKDIAPGESSSYPAYLTPFGEGVLFSVQSPAQGLWYSDGTEAGTWQIKEIETGTPYSGLSQFTAFNGGLYFVVYDPAGQYWLWQSDGTSDGTLALKKLPAGHGPNNLRVIAGKLYYNLYQSLGNALRFETWVYDASMGSTVQLHPRDTVPYSHAFGGFTPLNDQVLFAKYTAASGSELWQTDGTPAGTYLLKDLFPGVGSSDPQNFVPLRTRLLFWARDQDQAQKVWATDGTAAGTLPLNNFNSRGIILTQGNLAYFFAQSPAHAYWTLWETDGTPAGTALFGGAFYNINHALALKNDWIVFYASSLDGISRWWRANTSTKIIEPFNPVYLDNGPGVDPNLNSKVAALGNQVLFVATAGGTDQVYRADKDQLTVVPLTSFNHPYYYSGPQSLTAASGRVYFSIQVTDSAHEIWSTDGSITGTGPLPLYSSGLIKGTMSIASALNQDIVLKNFLGDSALLWRYQTSTDSLIFLKKFKSFSYTPFIQVNSKLYFIAKDQDSGDELWTTDGSPQGTYLVKDINPGPNSSGIYTLASDGQMLYFRADDGQHGREPWRSDGTQDGTFMLADIYSDGSSNPISFTEVKGQMYFRAAESSKKYDLWVTDGSTVGTTKLKNFPPYVNTFGGFAMARYLDQLVFVANDSLRGWELWTSDGTTGGTTFFMDVFPGKLSSRPDGFTAFDSLLFFTAFTPENGRELWQTDGTIQGTKIVQDILPGPGSSTPGGLTVQSNRLYFSAYAPGSGRELWRYIPSGASPTFSQDSKQGTGFQIIPNPAQITQRLNLHRNPNQPPAHQAALFDLTGRLLRQWPLDPNLEINPLDLSGAALQPGMYLIQLTGPSGAPVAVLKCMLMD